MFEVYPCNRLHRNVVVDDDDDDNGTRMNALMLYLLKKLTFTLSLSLRRMSE